MVPPLLSIIIVAYKSRDEIGGCLGSIPRELHGRGVEVIVVDNSAGDGAGELIREKFAAVGYIDPGRNLGFGRANNLGYRTATGELVLFLNPDTVVNEPALAQVTGRLLAEPDVGLISPRLELADGSMDLACRRSIPSLWDGFARATGLASAFPRRAIFSGYNLTHLPVEGAYEVGAINGAFMLGRKSTFDQVSEPPGSGAVFDESFFMYGDDLDLCLRVTRGGWKIIYDGSHAIVHLKGVSVAKEYTDMSRAIFDANRAVFIKHFGRSGWARAQYTVAFAAWKFLALARARLRGHRRVRPL